MGLTPDQRSLLYCYDRSLLLDPITSSTTVQDGLHVERFTIASIHGQRVPAILYRAAVVADPLPVVIVGHGAGQSKDEPLLHTLFVHWARLGFACVGIDAPFHGERFDRPLDPAELLLHPYGGLDFVVQSVVDSRRAVDWIETRSELDSHRIVYAGFSMGTILGVQFVALEQRVRAAAFALGGAGVVHYLALQAPAPLRAAAERVADATDPLHFAPLISPRPVLMVNGSRDEVIPAALGQLLFNTLKEPRRIIWYDGRHGDIPHDQIEAMRLFLAEAVQGEHDRQSLPPTHSVPVESPAGGQGT